ncbi:2-aminoethylphosphonate ABC transporter permease subunit [Kyrpidia spormannii]|uniref:Phosphonate ABC transporter permease (Modular protein) n=1 Tax=Kyrpidia spormannii TaxID=2055160 RepID=A0ACA8Z7C4_9BACL|nr:2-aminoethylphosphonate ABC transporter permease subunit [Kyrpidia spormannii]CAB3391444.1 Phosphonate ABC transporter permease (modular protein) [Kyrpidia spormannii]
MLASKSRFGWPLAVAGLVFIPLVVYPGWMLISLQGDGAGGVWTEWSTVLHSAALWRTVWFSLGLSLESTVFAVLIGVGVAVAIHRSPPGFARWLVRSVELMVAFPSFLIAFSLIFLYGSQGSITAGVQHLLHLSGPPWDFLYGRAGVVFAEVCYYIPFMIRPTLAVLERMDPALPEAAAGLGARPGRVWRRVILPMAYPGISAGAILCFLLIQNEFGILLVLGSQQVQTLPMLIYSTAMMNLDLPAASVTATVMLGMSLAIYALYRQVERWSLGGGGVFVGGAKGTGGSVGKSSGWAAWIATLAVVIVFVLPIMVVVVSALARTWVGTVLPEGWTWRWFAVLDASDWASLGVSIAVAGAVALLATVIGTGAALLLRRRRGGIAGLIDALIMIPGAVPSVVVGLAVLAAYHQKPLDLSGSPAIVILVQLFLALPFSYRMLLAIAETMPPALEEAAAGLGAGPWRRIRRVQIPLLLPGMRASAALAFALSLGELGATMMVCPPGFATAPMQILQYMQRGYYYQGSALAVLLLLAGFLGLAAVAALGVNRRSGWALARKGLRRDRRAVDRGAGDGADIGAVS